MHYAPSVAHNGTHVSEFVAIIRGAVEKFPASDKKKRIMNRDENCATALEGLLDEGVDDGASIDDLRRLQAAVNRAFDEKIRARWSLSARTLFYATGAETASNSKQNEDTHAVLTTGTLGDVERCYESTRIQRDMSDVLLEALAARASELRAAARA